MDVPVPCDMFFDRKEPLVMKFKSPYPRSSSPRFCWELPARWRPPPTFSSLCLPPRCRAARTPSSPSPPTCWAS